VKLASSHDHLAVQVDNKEQQAMILQTTGVAYKLLGRSEEALRNYQHSMELNTTLGKKRGVAAHLNRNTCAWRTAVDRGLYHARFTNPVAVDPSRRECLATRLGSTVALVANESINQHFESHAENFCCW
jgi:hypothetical protein